MGIIEKVQGRPGPDAPMIRFGFHSLGGMIKCVQRWGS